jgi:prolyl-tRNA editing enzyme YbaK/EbsC (Cys-tRNA(Pro) deacylase)
LRKISCIDYHYTGIFYEEHVAMDQKTLSSGAQRVQDALLTSGYPHQVVEHAEGTRSAADAARVIGCQVAQIVKTLIFMTTESRRPVLVAASGANRVNEAALAGRLGEDLTRANPDFVKEVTGFSIGAVPPVGLRTPVLAFVDEDLFHYREVWAAAGSPSAVFCLTPAELAQMTGGQVVKVS